MVECSATAVGATNGCWLGKVSMLSSESEWEESLCRGPVGGSEWEESLCRGPVGGSAAEGGASLCSFSCLFGVKLEQL